MGDRGWFREGLQRRGYDVASLDGFVSGKPDLRAVPLLLRAVRDEDAAVRRGADVALRRISGRSHGSVDRGTPPDQVRAVAERWAAWWQSRQAAAAAGRR
jgi:hypothetical protein